MRFTLKPLYTASDSLLGTVWQTALDGSLIATKWLTCQDKYEVLVKLMMFIAK